MNRQVVGPCLSKRLKKDFRLVAHQMHVEGQASQGAQTRNQCRAEREVRDKMPIHDVQVEPVCTGVLDPQHFSRQPPIIGRQQGRGNNHATNLMKRASPSQRRSHALSAPARPTTDGKVMVWPEPASPNRD